MANDTVTAALEQIGAHFRARIAALMQAWRDAVLSEPRLAASRSPPRSQLEDHLPMWLEAFAAAVAGEPSAAAEDEQDAEAHGLQRWQQGYDLHDVTREWGCLHRCLVDELENLASARKELPVAALAQARARLAVQISEATSVSVEKYFRLERVAAAGSLLDLERALADVRELERQRGELWQQAAHDLRGNLGVVSNVTQGLGFRDLPAERRDHFVDLLGTNVTALHRLLDDVTSLARLQAGQEQRKVAAFDAAEMLRRLADDVRPLADAAGISVEVRGPKTLDVEGDAVKVRRIAQNLVLNALKYTNKGAVTVSWEEAESAHGDGWRFIVADGGPGFHAGPGAPIVSALNPVGSEPATLADAPDASVPAPSDDDARPIEQAQGEGIGLAIVKRLADLLDARIEIDTAPGQGTTVRVFLPRRYPRLPA